MNMVWHYAPWAYLEEISRSGALKPSNAKAENEHPLLWFSANQKWEPTATKMRRSENGEAIPLTFAEQAESFGCIRFGLPASDSRLLNWPDSCKAAGTPGNLKRGMENAGRRCGANPYHWFAVSSEIRLNELHFQVWIDGQWHPAPGAIEEYAEAWRTRNTAT